MSVLPRGDGLYMVGLGAYFGIPDDVGLSV